MDFSLRDEQRLTQQTAQRIAADVLAPSAAEIDAGRVFPRASMARIAEAGLLGILVPPVFGGAGSDTLSFVLTTEALAKACASTAFVYTTHVAAGFGILVGGSDAAKKRLLPAIASGKKIGAFAVTESGSGANPMAIQTRAERAEGSYVITGSKTFITGAGEADLYITSAVTDPANRMQGLSLLAAEKSLPGLTFGTNDETMGLRGARRGEIFFDACAVPVESLLGTEGAGLATTMAIGGLGVLGAAATSLGLAQAALETATAHAKNRVVAGQPIGSHQAVQFMIADMSIATDAARALLYHAVYQRETAPPGPPLLSFKAKLFASEAAISVTDRALQVHGGNGYSRELPLERYYRDARGLSLHFSVTEPLKEIIGKMVSGLWP